MTTISSGPARLRALLGTERSVLAVGAFDALTARLAQRADFPVVYLTGFGVSAASYGLPDLGFLASRDMLDVCEKVALAIDVPLIVDADTGYGGPGPAYRAAQAFERAGAAGIQIEDQVDPKRCGHLSGKAVIPVEAMLARLRAVLDARTNEDFLVIARTDARAVEGFDAAVERALRYREEGADMIFVEAPETVNEIEQLPNLIPAPLVFNWSYGGRSPDIRKSDLERLGYRLIIFPDVVLAAHRALHHFFQRFAETDSLEDLHELLSPFDEVNAFLDLDAWERRMHRKSSLRP